MHILESVGDYGMDIFCPERERVYFCVIGKDRMKIRSYYTKEDRDRFRRNREDRVVSKEEARNLYKFYLNEGFEKL